MLPVVYTILFVCLVADLKLGVELYFDIMKYISDRL